MANKNLINAITKHLNLTPVTKHSQPDPNTHTSPLPDNDESMEMDASDNESAQTDNLTVISVGSAPIDDTPTSATIVSSLPTTFSRARIRAPSPSSPTGPRSYADAVKVFVTPPSLLPSCPPPAGSSTSIVQQKQVDQGQTKSKPSQTPPKSPNVEAAEELLEGPLHCRVRILKTGRVVQLSKSEELAKVMGKVHKRSGPKPTITKFGKKITKLTRPTPLNSLVFLQIPSTSSNTASTSSNVAPISFSQPPPPIPAVSQINTLTNQLSTLSTSHQTSNVFPNFS